jgi:hypothetical protein
MRIIFSILTLVAGFATHAAINRASNSSCPDRVGGVLFAQTNPPESKLNRGDSQPPAQMALARPEKAKR